MLEVFDIQRFKTNLRDLRCETEVVWKRFFLNFSHCIYKTGNLGEIFDACAVVPQLQNCRIQDNETICKQLKKLLRLARYKQSYGLVKSSFLW